jgi:Fusaric acid resistance protein family
MTFAGFPGSSWAFAIRIWLAIVIALYVSFWLELEAPSSAAVTVAILALPTRGQILGRLFSELARLPRRKYSFFLPSRHGSDSVSMRSACSCL